MLQNSRVTAFTFFELLWENQLGGWVKLPTPIPLTQIRVKDLFQFTAHARFTETNTCS